MVGPVRSNPLGGISAVGNSRKGDGNVRTGATLGRIAGRVADRMTREFALLRDGGERSQGGFAGHEDIYEIAEAARELSGDLGGKPVDEGRLAHSLGSFAQESAALFAARPGASSLDAIARAIAGRDSAELHRTIADALRQIDQTTRDVVEARPR